MSVFPVTDGVTTFIPPPEGYHANFENPQSQYRHQHFFIFGFLGSLALLCLIQRLYTKRFIIGGLKVDDYLITAAWVASVVMQSVQIWSISIGGLCHHAWEMPIQVFEKHMLSSYIAAPVFITCNGLCKASLLSLYLQISPQTWFKVSIWTIISMVACYTITIVCLLLFACKPIRASWDTYEMAAAACIDTADLYMAIAVANIASDVFLFIVPIRTVAGLKMPRAQKAVAVVIFGVASLTVATSCIRMFYLPSLLGAIDIPWVAAPANVWSVLNIASFSFVEVNLFIICGSVPTLRKFLKRLAPKFLCQSSSQTSEPDTHRLPATRPDLQQHTRDDWWLDGLEMDKVYHHVPASTEMASSVYGCCELSLADCQARAIIRLDDRSEEAILDRSSDDDGQGN